MCRCLAFKYPPLSESLYFSIYIIDSCGSEMQHDGGSVSQVAGNINGLCRQGQTNQRLSAVEERFSIIG